MFQDSITATSKERLDKVISRVASVLSSDRFPTGDRASLKRIDPNGSPSLSFYRFAFDHLPEHWEHRTEAWMSLVAGIALMYPHPHQSDRPVGKVLAESGYSEARLERLLSSEGPTLNTLLLRSVRFMAAKKESCNWTDYARLLLAVNPAKREEARLHIARAFYRNLKEKE